MSDTTVNSFRSELRVSPTAAIVTLAGLSQGLIVIGALLPNRTVGESAMDLVLPVFGLAALAWVINAWKVSLGRWIVVLSFVAVVELLAWTQRMPEALVLLAIPVALAAALNGVLAAGITATAATALLLAHGQTSAPVGPNLVVVGCAAVWCVLGVMAMMRWPMTNLARWSWDHYSRARVLLEEARDRHVELAQALQDLARANLQLKRLNNLALALRHSAEEARRAKEEFVANVSHELRTPLNMILGFGEMITQAPETYGRQVPPTLLADLEVIHRNAQHLAGLIDDVLDLSQLDAGRLNVVKEPSAVAEIIDDAAIIVRPLYESKGLSLEIDVADNLGPVNCDRTRIREVVLNLVSNAGRFTERGGVTVRAWEERSWQTISVSDTGPGIAAEHRERVFRPFERLDATIRRRYGGTGLGLAISKRFVELHEGEMWFESEAGLGTTFFFRLPLGPSLDIDRGALRWFNPDLPFEERTRPSQAPAVEVPPRFIVLDEGDSVRRLLARQMDGVEIAGVASLHEACDELGEQPARAVIVNTASVSGTLQSLSAPSALPAGTPTRICSIAGTHEATLALGAAEYLIKPVSRDALLQSVARLAPPKGSILVVDDEPGALQLFGRMLGSAGRGYRVLLARDGGEALSILRERRPDAMVLDLVMPGMDGFQLLEITRADSDLRSIPVVVVSARDPGGQPIVSSALAVAQPGGISAHQVLACVGAISQILSAAD